ncbi:Pentatricopeptide repeat [Dillenia turbinata]|uniref:Pentatricopeptide repeat n=1 Tax=Dillenia turbinata TaxID=194707 RepID=A0AAN8V2K7_9MAGN
MFESQRLYIKNLISVLIQGCKNMSEIKQIQTQIITSPCMLKSDQNFLINRLLFVCALSDMGSLRYAETIFQQIENPKLSDYNIMIRASACKFDEHLESGICRALILYKRMLVEEIRPDFLTFPFLVKECARRFDGVVGRSIHAHILKLGFESDLFIQNFLIDFYFVSRALESARKVFDEMLNRDLVSWNSMVIGCLRNGDLDAALDLFRRMEKRNVITWNSMITGFVQGGRSKEALELFHEMQLMSDGAVKPDKITIASILSACASLGAIDHGKWVHDYFKRSALECDVVIGTALIDMYGKCGCVQRAVEAKRFSDVKRVRAFMKERGFKKESPGCSMIEVGGVVYEFSVKGSLYVVMEEVEWVLNQLSDEMKRMHIIYQNQKSLDTEFS